MNVEIINEIRNKKLPFPEVIRQLLAIGIERYYTDLINMEKIYYSHQNESFTEKMSIDNIPVLASDFNEKQVKEAIQASQRGEIDYPTFLRTIIAAGTASYTVFLDGKKVVYVGRKGESHTEDFHF